MVVMRGAAGRPLPYWRLRSLTTGRTFSCSMADGDARRFKERSSAATVPHPSGDGAAGRVYCTSRRANAALAAQNAPPANSNSRIVDTPGAM